MDSQKNRFEQDTIEYWEKVLKIETVLNLEFKPNSNEVDFQTVNEVEKLYQCLVNKVPYRENKSFNTISGNWNIDDTTKNSIGKSIYLTFEGQEHFHIYEEEFDLFYRSYVFNCVFRNIEENENGKVTLYLDNIDDEKRRYTSTLLFQNKSELDAYNFEENIEKFQVAKSYFEINKKE